MSALHFHEGELSYIFYIICCIFWFLKCVYCNIKSDRLMYAELLICPWWSQLIIDNLINLRYFLSTSYGYYNVAWCHVVGLSHEICCRFSDCSVYLWSVTPGTWLSGTFISSLAFLVAVTFCWCHCHIQDLPYLRFVCSLSLIMSLNVQNTYTAMSCLCNFLPIIFANKMCKNVIIM